MAKHRLTFYDRMMRAGASGSVAWLTWVNDPGTNNLQDTFEGGEPLSVPYGIIDLSAVASYQLGRQVPQSAKFILRGVTIAYRPHDSGVANESDAMFAGKLKWITDTAHGREALALAREIERETEKEAVDADSFLLSTDKDYSAMRMNWSNAGDVAHGTVCSTLVIPAGEWTINQVGAYYDSMTAPSETNALFNGRFPGRQAIGWSATVAAGTAPTGGGLVEIGDHGDYEREGLYHEVLAGLLSCTVEHSTDAQFQGLVEDDYQWFIGLDYEVVV